LALPVAVIRKFADDEGPNLAGLIAFRAFFSLFPLLLLLTTILGYVLSGDPTLRQEAFDSVLSQFPVVGEQLRAGTLHGSAAALALGIAGSIWAGFGVVLATERALDRIWAVPFHERRNFVTSRLRALLLLAALGALALVSTIASGLAGGGVAVLGPFIGRLALSLIVNGLLFGVVFGLLGSRRPTPRAILPGVLLAACSWTALQLGGGYFVAHEIRNAAPAYGTFALVLGLLVWLDLGATLIILSAEVNVVTARGLWPRSMFGIGVPADERVLAELARSQARDTTQRVESAFRPSDASGVLSALAASAPRAASQKTDQCGDEKGPGDQGVDEQPGAEGEGQLAEGQDRDERDRGEGQYERHAGDRDRTARP
jgi:YihY family inner membrane protein